jgi:hypothetical protein
MTKQDCNCERERVKAELARQEIRGDKIARNVCAGITAAFLLLAVAVPFIPGSQPVNAYQKPDWAPRTLNS